MPHDPALVAETRAWFSKAWNDLRVSDSGSGMTIDLFERVASLEEIEGLAPSVLSIGSEPAIKYWHPWPAKAAADYRRMDTHMSHNLG